MFDSLQEGCIVLKEGEQKIEFMNDLCSKFMNFLSGLYDS